MIKPNQRFIMDSLLTEYSYLPIHQFSEVYYCILHDIVDFAMKMNECESYERYLTEMAQNGDMRSMFKLCSYYRYIKKDYAMLKKCYIMIAEAGNSDALFTLACDFEFAKDYDKMIEYYILAIEYGNINAMFWLGSYYQRIGNCEQMKKYYDLASGRNHSVAKNNLQIYERLENRKK